MTNEEFQARFDQFRADVAGHVVTVLRDDGLYRHLRCSAGSYYMQFYVITWPGYLCYVGDMGSYVFSRLPDMFEFFRGREGATIDRSYLAEKVVASDKHDGIHRFSEQMFAAAVKSDYDAFVGEHEIAADEAADLWQAIEDDVLSCGDNHQDAVGAALAFRWSPDGRASDKGCEVFCDFWERRLEDYTALFSWCCYAIPWAIQQYDALCKSASSVVAEIPMCESPQA